MWAWCGCRLARLRGAAWMNYRLSEGVRGFSKGFNRRKESFGWRKKLWSAAAAGGSLLLVGVQAARHTPVKCLREGGLFLDPEDDQLVEATPMEMNEAAALTHTSLLKQASGVAVDGAIQLLHRTLRAILDFSQQHRKQLHEVVELLEHCTTMLRHAEEHDRLWDLLVVARARADLLKQQLRDLNLLLTYACSAVENTAMAAFISGGEFSASTARQVTDDAKLELTTDERKTEAIEMQYTIAHTRYIEAAQKMMDDVAAEAAADRDEDDDGEDDATMGSGDSEKVEKRTEIERQEGRREGYTDDDVGR